MNRNTQNDNFGRIDLAAFFIITFVISWGLLAPYILAPGLASSTLGDIGNLHPVFFIAVWSPAISAFIVIFYRTGLRGLVDFLSRLLLWRAPLSWLLLIAIGLPAVFYLGAWIKGEALLPTALSGSMFDFLVMMVLFLFLGPVEELGWRGVAQPLLQRYITPFWAGILIGLIWGLWHLPVFYLGGTLQSDWHFLSFFIGVICLSLLVTPIYNAGKGGLLLPVLFHYQAMNPLWPDAQPYDSYLLLVAVGILVMFFPKTMFSRSGSHVAVLPEAATTGGIK